MRNRYYIYILDKDGNLKWELEVENEIKGLIFIGINTVYLIAG
ncbi:hypothetical protein [Desulfurobacterium atlanticum]